MNNEKINLSIIVPVYNTEKYLEKCLSSILKNIPENAELIIINDGSPDNSESIIKEFEDKYKDIIKYFKKANGGLSDTKNFGLSKASGKYITFVDSDDYVDENMHKEMLKLALEKDADVVYCDIEKVYENGNTIISHCTNFKHDTDYFKLIDAPLMAASCNKLIKKELYDNFSFPVGLINEDIAVTPILLANAKSIYKIDKPFYKYFQRSDSIQNSTFDEKRLAIFDAVKICFEQAKNLPKDIQSQIKGAIYTHQILAYLLYPIAELPIEEQVKLIPIFCKKYNEFGEDAYQNIYVKEYSKDLYADELLELIKKEDFDSIPLCLKVCKALRERGKIDLSIIVPVYNTEKYLEKCLNSVLKNIPANTELIIINDGSPDNSEKIIKKFQEQYLGIVVYLKKANGGLSDTKNFGISRASGKYITFVDSDDYVDENMHKEMLELALEKDADVVYCDVEQVYENGNTTISYCTNFKRDTDYFKLIDTPLMAASWNKLVKKELFSNFSFPVGLNNEDIAVTPILLANAKSIYKIDKPFYKYFQRSGSIQNSCFDEKRFVIFDTAKICFEQAKKLSEEIQAQIRGSVYTHQILALLIYPICELPKKNQLKLIPLFCKKYNEFGEDAYQNIYVKEYAKNLHTNLLLYLIKKEKVKTIILWLKLYKLIRPR